MAYYDNINTTIFDLVPSESTRILELGCGAGALAAAIREKCPHLNYYAGIELDAEQAARSRQHTHVTLQRDLDSLNNWELDAELSSQIPAGHFDLAIMGDVLEHLYSPLETLQQTVTRIKVGGHVIACIPNVQHWSVFKSLVQGTWPQHDMGIFDRTHIRWFTLDDMVRLLSAAGLEVSHIVPRAFESEEGVSILEDLEPLARNMGVDPDALISRGLALQFVLVAKKKV